MQKITVILLLCYYYHRTPVSSFSPLFSNNHSYRSLCFSSESGLSKTRLNYANRLDIKTLPDTQHSRNDKVSAYRNKRNENKATQKRKRQHEKQKLKSFSKHEDQWNLRYSELLDFYNLNGHSNVPYNYPNRKLSRWVTNQRQYVKLKKPFMTTDRIKALHEVKFRFNTSRSTWEDRFHELKQFRLLYGHCNVKSTTNRDLARFVSSQRRQYQLYIQIINNNGTDTQNIGNCSMTEERIEALNSIDFDFEFKDNSIDSVWNEKYHQLKQYYQKYKDCSVPRENKMLRQWVYKQRSAYKLFNTGEKSSITQEKIDLLNGINFVWDPVDARFKERIQELKKFYIENQHCNVPLAVNPQMHTWIKRQREQYHQSCVDRSKYTFSRERLDQLKEAGLDLVKDRKLKKSSWTIKFLQLEQYANENGHCIVPQSHTQLGKFVRAQRNSYRLFKMGRKTGITQERIDKLNSIGFVWKVDNKRYPRQINEVDLVGRNNIISTGSRVLLPKNDVDTSPEVLLRCYEKLSLWG